MSAIHNKRVELAAGALSNTAVALTITGVATLVLNVIYGIAPIGLTLRWGVIPLGLLFVGLGLHALAQVLLGRLKDA